VHKHKISLRNALPRLVVENAVRANICARPCSYGYSCIVAAARIASDIGPFAQVRVLGKIIDHENTFAEVTFGSSGGGNWREIDSRLTTCHVAGYDSVSHCERCQHGVSTSAKAYSWECNRNLEANF
jgi:hypothetical protein